MSQKNFTSYFALFLFSILTLNLSGQNVVIEAKVKNEILQNSDKYNLSHNDAQHLLILNQYTDEKRGISYIYVGQKLNEIPIYNVQTTFYISRKGQIGTVASGFINTDKFQVSGSRSAIISVEQAIRNAALNVGVVNPKTQLKEKKGDNPLFDAGNISQLPIEPQMTYFKTSDNELTLGYVLQIKKINSMDHYQIVVDGVTGKILNKVNYTLSCKFDGPDQYTNHSNCDSHDHINIISTNEQSAPPPPSAEVSSYRVFELPLEAPNFGASKLITSPADPTASPYGWHDLDGTEGVDNTTLQGNNVHAFNDNSGDYAPDSEVDGGTELSFDKVFDITLEPQMSKDAAAVNLFYMINKMHDFSYNYGFDENAGNFQLDNYGKGGQGGDYVLGMSQFGNGDGDFKNNADFSTPGDGGNGSMRMFLWDSATDKFQILSPASIAGGYEVGDPGFGPAISSTPVEAEVVMVEDKLGNKGFFCEDAKNADKLVGKVVAINRGGCDFSLKVYNAQQAGAVAAIIMNFEEQVIGMASGLNGGSVTIPSVFVAASTGNLIKGQLTVGEKVVSRMVVPENSGPSLLDASYDNGVIAHEFGHGISNRLTGGPSNSGCLNSAEQMGEGWSDFMALVTSKRPGDKATDGRGIGTYVQGQQTNGSGIRRFPYSTDMTICPNTFADVATVTGVHAIGEIWCDMIWDLYWAMIQKHGDDGLLYGGTGGNSRAIELVFQGMKLQPCGVGFQDGRDAILAADRLLYDGENECLIWEVFARRGLGFNASGGSSNSVSDNIVDFTPNLFCLNKVQMQKLVTKEVDPGEEITITLKLKSYKLTTAKNIHITDIVPEHSTYVAGSGGAFSNNVVTFNLDSLVSADEHEFQYKVKVDANYKSILMYQEDFNTEFDFPDGDWFTNLEDGEVFFEFFDGAGEDGSGAYSISSKDGDYKTSFQKTEKLTIAGENPYLIMAHRYNTQGSIDGGNIRYSNDEVNWFTYDQEVVRGKYPGKLAYASLTIPNLPAFSGNSNGYVHSFVGVKAQDTEQLFLSIYYGASDGNATYDSWDIDNFEMVDAKFLNSEACITVDGDAEECLEAVELGTYVKHDGILSSKKANQANFESVIYPNPGNGSLNISWKQVSNESMEIKVMDASGKIIAKGKKQSNAGVNFANLNLNALQSGLYMVQLTTASGSVTHKYVKM